MVQIFKGPGPGFGTKVRVQVLERAPCIYMEIKLRHRCSPVNLLRVSKHLVMRTTLKDCFCMLEL